MNNMQRLEMEIQGIELPQEQKIIYLEEVGLLPFSDYDTKSNSNKKSIYECALSILEGIANNPQLMKEVKLDDMTVSKFSDSIQQRIDALQKRIRQMPDDNSDGTGWFLFSR
ncbi:hypothetical protein [Lysinibacillus sp. GbtcB16]|uniref:hypothetical protein n=1 Tax=Lysinibacillus sp. GbtcB16 TaxID=2824761 RepID=UPI001C307C46|nr:hypothetical protein [Lysinibacillus sp. GbtcB16]